LNSVATFPENAEQLKVGLGIFSGWHVQNDF